MGARDSKLEYEYYVEELNNVNPSTAEFEFWISIHNIFKEVYEIPRVLAGISKELPTQALGLTIGKSLQQEQVDIVKQLDQAVQAVTKAENFGVNCTKFSLQILDKAYQDAYFSINYNKHNKSVLTKVSDFASNLLAAKCEAEKFPFEFKKYKACILEFIRYLHFMYDFDTHTQRETKYIQSITSLRKLIGPALTTALADHKAAIQSDADTVARAASFLNATTPLTQVFARHVKANGATQQILVERSIGRVLISACMTLHKNENLNIEETDMLLKAVTEGLLLLDCLEDVGVFAEQVSQKLPSILVVQTLALYARPGVTEAASEHQALSLDLLYDLKTKCRIPKDTPPVILQL